MEKLQFFMTCLKNVDRKPFLKHLNEIVFQKYKDILSGHYRGPKAGLMKNMAKEIIQNDSIYQVAHYDYSDYENGDDFYKYSKQRIIYKYNFKMILLSIFKEKKITDLVFVGPSGQLRETTLKKERSRYTYEDDFLNDICSDIVNNYILMIYTKEYVYVFFKNLFIQIWPDIEEPDFID